MKKLLAFLLVLAMGWSSCFAGTGPDQKHIDKIRKQVSRYLDRGAMVSVETYDHHKLWGEINEAGPESFVLTVGGQPKTLPYAEIRKIKAPMDPGTKRRIISGLVIGGLLGTLFIVAAQDK